MMYHDDIWAPLAAQHRGERLRVLRGEITIGDLAIQMGVSRDWIARRESGEVEITVRDLHRWEEALCVLRDHYDYRSEVSRER